MHIVPRFLCLITLLELEENIVVPDTKSRGCVMKTKILTLTKILTIVLITVCYSYDSNAQSRNDGLLYEGDYTQGTLVARGSGMTMPPAMINHHIKIYEDHIEDMGTWKYIGTSGGNRVYTSQQGWSPTVTVEYHVDNSFNITEYRPVPGMYGPVTYVSHFSKGNVSYDTNNQSHNQTYENSNTENPRQIEYYEEDCYSCHGTGKCPSCNGTHRINYQFGSGTLECPNCKPNGACSTCNGSGKVKKMRVN